MKGTNWILHWPQLDRCNGEQRMPVGTDLLLEEMRHPQPSENELLSAVADGSGFLSVRAVGGVVRPLSAQELPGFKALVSSQSWEKTKRWGDTDVWWKGLDYRIINSTAQAKPPDHSSHFSTSDQELILKERLRRQAHCACPGYSPYHRGGAGCSFSAFLFVGLNNFLCTQGVTCVLRALCCET